jgi:hypothetical protein
MIQRVAQDVVSALRGQPFGLALVIINILVLVSIGPIVSGGLRPRHKGA